MDEKTLRILLHREILSARFHGNEAKKAHRKMGAGEICTSCKCPLPEPHTSGPKRCASCAGKHHVRMSFYRSYGWNCSFYSERWQRLPKRLVFRQAASIWETAKRGNGLIDDAARKRLELLIEVGRGGIMLRLTDEQFRAIGGVPPAAPSMADKIGAEAENISSETGFSPNRP